MSYSVRGLALPGKHHQAAGSAQIRISAEDAGECCSEARRRHGSLKASPDGSWKKTWKWKEILVATPGRPR
jgi:hypothetical protein